MLAVLFFFYCPLFLLSCVFIPVQLDDGCARVCVCVCVFVFMNVGLQLLFSERESHGVREIVQFSVVDQLSPR